MSTFETFFSWLFFLFDCRCFVTFSFPYRDTHERRFHIKNIVWCRKISKLQTWQMETKTNSMNSLIIFAFWLVLSYVLLATFSLSILKSKIDSILPGACTVMDHRRHLASSVSLFYFYHILMLTVIYHCGDPWQQGIYFEPNQIHR